MYDFWSQQRGSAKNINLGIISMLMVFASRLLEGMIKKETLCGKDMWTRIWGLSYTNVKIRKGNTLAAGDRAASDALEKIL